MPCVLRYWDPTQKCYITYKDFNLSENNATSIALPDPSTAHPSEVIVAAEWQMVVDVTVDIDYPDDGRLVPSGRHFCARLTQPKHFVLNEKGISYLRYSFLEGDITFSNYFLELGGKTQRFKLQKFAYVIL